MVHFLGFEDMYVLQAKQRDEKYEESHESTAKTIKFFTSAKHKKNALGQFFKMIVINHFVQNGDAHLKNYGLLYEDIDNVKLAPAYDVVSTTMYIKNDYRPCIYWEVKNGGQETSLSGLASKPAIFHSRKVMHYMMNV